MSKYYLKEKRNKQGLKVILKVVSLGILVAGFMITSYVFFPLISWQIYFAPVFASQVLTAPIPQNSVVNPSMVQSLISQAGNIITGVDYTNAQNWFPNYNSNFSNQKNVPKVSSYALSIPILGIQNASVSTVDNNLKEHLVNYEGTAIPGDNGNSVIFGHSTLPQLFNPKDYTTIFATLYKLKLGDKIYATVNGVTYAYKINNIIVVDPNDTSIFSQNYENSHLTLVTCTPPGTTWKRLIIKANLESI